LSIHGPPSAMSLVQRLPASLTPLDVALATLLRGLEPVTVVELPLTEALGCVTAELPPLKAYPPHDVAAADGWALRTRDLVGASSYTPVPLTMPEFGSKRMIGCRMAQIASSMPIPSIKAVRSSKR